MTTCTITNNYQRGGGAASSLTVKLHKGVWVCR